MNNEVLRRGVNPYCCVVVGKPWSKVTVGGEGKISGEFVGHLKIYLSVLPGLFVESGFLGQVLLFYHVVWFSEI